MGLRTNLKYRTLVSVFTILPLFVIIGWAGHSMYGLNIREPQPYIAFSMVLFIGIFFYYNTPRIKYKDDKFTIYHRFIGRTYSYDQVESIKEENWKLGKWYKGYKTFISVDGKQFVFPSIAYKHYTKSLSEFISRLNRFNREDKRKIQIQKNKRFKQHMEWTIAFGLILIAYTFVSITLEGIVNIVVR